MAFRISFFSPRAASLSRDSEAQVQSVDFKKLYERLLEKGFHEVTGEYPLSNLANRTTKPTTVYVDWGCAVVAPLSTFIATDGLSGCSALKVVDKKVGLQYLIHVFRDETLTSMIECSLYKAGKLGIDLDHSEMELMPGLFTDKPSSPRILEALYRINPELVDKVTLVRDLSREGERQGLIMHDSKTYRYPREGISFDYRHYSIGTVKYTIETNGFIRVL